MWHILLFITTITCYQLAIPAGVSQTYNFQTDKFIGEITNGALSISVYDNSTLINSCIGQYKCIFNFPTCNENNYNYTILAELFDPNLTFTLMEYSMEDFMCQYYSISILFISLIGLFCVVGIASVTVIYLTNIPFRRRAEEMTIL